MQITRSADFERAQRMVSAATAEDSASPYQVFQALFKVQLIHATV